MINKQLKTERGQRKDEKEERKGQETGTEGKRKLLKQAHERLSEEIICD